MSADTVAALLIGGAVLVHSIPLAQAQEQRAHFTVSVDGGLHPVIHGNTNLPDGTNLFVSLKKPYLRDAPERVARGLAACGEDCFPATTGPNYLFGATVAVRGGAFVAGPFSFKGQPFRPGSYPLEISLSADPRTATLDEIRTIGIVLFATTIHVPSNQDYQQAPAEPNRAIQSGSPQKIDDTKRTSVAGQRERALKCAMMRRDVTSWTEERQAAYRRMGCWQKVEADSGSVYRIDLGSIQRLAAGATTAVYSDEGGAFNAMNLKRWYFDCRGHFQVMQDDLKLGPMVYAPPRSVAAQVSDFVCAGAGVSKGG